MNKGSENALIILGLTGAGKSETANTIAGSEALFPSSASIHSVTNKTVYHEVEWFRNPGKFKYTIIDTPGLEDSEGRDQEHIAETVEVLRAQIRQLKAFVLVMNGAYTRLD